MAKDRYRLYRLKKEQKIEQYQKLLEKSQQQVQARIARLPHIQLNQDLPVSQYAEKLINAIQQYQVIIVAGETGSGKTTQLPQIAMLARRGLTGLIGHTQPRRLAARSVSQRIAEELGEPLGQTVSFKVRFNEQGNEDSIVRLMTDGILLAELANDRYLTKYDTIIIDEAHERSLNIDFILGYLKTILAKRPDLKVIVTSATLDVERFSRYFHDAPIFQVEGRSYPVEVRYRPISELSIVGSDDDEFDEFEENLPRAVVQAVEECFADAEHTGHPEHADILIFASTEQEIRELQDILQKQQFRHVEILPLYARLALSEQQKIFNPTGAGRRIIIATNVAETALTVPNIRYVIDSGFARISRYSYRSRVQRLPIEAISQASANQRKGRCGRIAEGVCIRLYSEEDFLSRPAFTEPEIKRTNLASVILQMQNLGLGDVNEFDFIEPPDYRLVNDGRKLLIELGALPSETKTQAKKNKKSGSFSTLTKVGQMMAKMPIDPRLARMLVAGNHFGALSEILIIVSALAVQDPRERPHDKQMQADQKHALFKAEDSDFLFYVNLWNTLETLKNEHQLSENKRRLFAKQHYLSWLRLREWRQTHQQLLEMSTQLGMTLNEKSASYENIHRALLTGLLSFIANKTEERNVFEAVRQQRARVFPASTLHKTNTPWVMAFEMVETSQVYLRTLAKIEPEWVILAAGDLLKYHYFEPHWSKKSGLVHAYAQISLFGLILEPKRLIQYEKVDLVNAHEIFIRDALVCNQLGIMPPFLQHNQHKLQEIQKVEDKLRRRDLVVDEEMIYQFYADKVDKSVASRQSFEQWRAKIEANNPKYLYFNEQDLWQTARPTTQQFPDELSNGSLKFKVKYHFDPSHERDGAIVTVPVHALSQMDIAQWSWGILGWRLSLIENLLKNLPKDKRRPLVPIPDTAQKLYSEIGDGVQKQHIFDVLAYLLRGDDIFADDFSFEKVDAYLLPFIHVVDAKGRVLEQGRDLAELQIRCRDDSQQVLIQSDEEYFEFPKKFQFEHQQKVTGVIVKQFQVVVPKIAFIDLENLTDGKKYGVILQSFNDEKVALSRYRQGIIHLIYLQLGDLIRQLKKQIPNNVSLAYAPLGNQAKLEQMLIYATLQRCIDKLPMNVSDYQQLLQQVKQQFLTIGQDVLAIFKDVFVLWQDIRSKMQGLNRQIFVDSLQDIEDQLELMQLSKCFYTKIPAVWSEYPRYLKALQLRLERLPNNLNRDIDAIYKMDTWAEKLFSLFDDKKREWGEAEQLFYQLTEEYRISLFSQPMKTKIAVSEKKLKEVWGNIL
ncbi:ATP-dependent RNA helicase HrpA [Moraxella sp. ZY210820]|uniref:ATP-dependent RNA helicase HrpA n=1 Tax=unclassified Moraxella TaxID=2685852 RepID=UPI0027316AC2|nr:ATP-dependent RNA helicase HrpA [Moraxella sp. ZY210820]WLF85111.1 ATP-dependent RNA helicase HrpA [Moraxella sp. ZY210820]